MSCKKTWHSNVVGNQISGWVGGLRIAKGLDKPLFKIKSGSDLSVLSNKKL